MSEPEWIPCGEKFTTGDVIRWKEAHWPERKRKRKGKVKPLGEHQITAQVLELDSREYVRLSVIKDEIVTNKHGMPLKHLAKGELIVRKRTTIGRGKAERMEWSEEIVRAIEVSKFLS